MCSLGSQFCLLRPPAFLQAREPRPATVSQGYIAERPAPILRLVLHWVPFVSCIVIACTHLVSCVLCLMMSCILHPVFCILYSIFCILYPVLFCILYPVSCILYSVSCILYLVPCVLYLIPCCQSCCSTLPRDGNHFGSSFCNELQITSDLNCIATRSCCCMWPTPCQNSEVRMRWITIIIRSSWQKRILHR